MFEKEAKLRAKDYTDNAKRQVAYECGFLDGVDLGYNKANEWHYVKDGEYPSKHLESYVVAFYGAKGSVAKGKPCWEELCWDAEFLRWVDKENFEDLPYVNTEGIVIAWKEIILPELKEGEFKSEMFPEIILPKGSSEFVDKAIADAEKRLKESE